MTTPEYMYDMESIEPLSIDDDDFLQMLDCIGLPNENKCDGNDIHEDEAMIISDEEDDFLQDIFSDWNAVDGHQENQKGSAQVEQQGAPWPLVPPAAPASSASPPFPSCPHQVRRNGVVQQQDERFESLALSMRRTENTRNKILYHRQPAADQCTGANPSSPVMMASEHDSRNASLSVGQQCNVEMRRATMAQSSPSPAAAITPQSLLSLSNFLAGNRSTLTAGLEQSRNMITQHAVLIASTYKLSMQ